jgi:hypothetical protein
LVSMSVPWLAIAVPSQSCRRPLLDEGGGAIVLSDSQRTRDLGLTGRRSGAVPGVLPPGMGNDEPAYLDEPLPWLEPLEIVPPPGLAGVAAVLDGDEATTPEYPPEVDGAVRYEGIDGPMSRYTGAGW